MATLIGKVGMVVKGEWSSSLAYEELDVVTYNNGTYIAIQAVPVNTLPTNTTYWQPALVSEGKIISTRSGSDPWTVPFVAGMLVAFARGAVSRKGLAIIDYQGSVVELVAFDGISVSVNTSESTVTITTNISGTVTVIYP